ncbi:cysteine-rich CWC family protein [Polynucleobacter brandtiae]|uniref:Cysteine-rich CWC n=1 Tax=Polynucleobacter brandtiae TaxID=1938816 RepID=A0A2M8VS03_9BURK|nr:cysteine-rich CWC family protein [Polynucleobacter brandtiae]PJI80246.1 Cysteine-rich CWC [Polynucleobacter brandtiae]
MTIENTWAICPVCGKSNSCQIDQVNRGGTCWCFGILVDQEKLESILGSKPKDQCLCSDCLNKLSV